MPATDRPGRRSPAAASILSPPFNQNTLPLIVPGPQVVAQTSSTAGHAVPGGNGNNLVTDGTVSSLNVTFDRPMQVSTFTPGQVLADHGPDRLAHGPQDFPSDFIGQAIPAAATSTGAGTLDSTLTMPSYDGTFLIARHHRRDQRRLLDRIPTSARS